MNSELVDYMGWQSLGHLLRERASTIGGRTLFRFGGVDTTFAEVEEQTNRLANVLAAHGVCKGDRVAVMLPNGVEFPIAWIAIGKVGAVMVPLNIQYRDADLEYTLNDSGASLALAGLVQVPILQRVQPHCPAVRGIVSFAPTGSTAGDIPDVRAEMAAA